MVKCSPAVTACACSGQLALCQLDGARALEAVSDAGERAPLAPTSRAWSPGVTSFPHSYCSVLTLLVTNPNPNPRQDELAEPAAVCQLITAGTLEGVLDASKRAALPRIDLPRLAAILPKYRHAPARPPKALAARFCGRVSGVF